jgi:tetratricopeptide (TPR) repeat protein
MKLSRVDLERISYGWRGVSSYNLRQFENAIQDYTSEITLFDGSAVTYVNRAFSYRALGDYANADSDDAKACSLDSQYC